jgi:DMSO reductase anchor subunit
MKIETNIQLIPSKKQKAWGWPAVVNFILGGLAAGFYILCFLDQLLQKNISAVSMPSICKALAPVLLGIGFFALIFEAGRPRRVYYLLRNLGTSWMSVESLTGMVFILSVIFSVVINHPAFPIVAAFSALIFMVSQGMILCKARAMPAWNISLMPILFLTSGLSMGSGLVLLLAALHLLSLSDIFLSVSLICVAMDMAAWLLYLHWSGDRSFLSATRVFRHPFVIAFNTGIGHAFPALLLLIEVISGMRFQDSIALLAGLSILIGGAVRKMLVVMGVGNMREITLGHSTRKALLQAEINYHRNNLT